MQLNKLYLAVSIKILSLLSLLAFPGVAIAQKDVFLFIGQSNTAGRTKFIDYSETDFYPAWVDLLNSQGLWEDAANLRVNPNDPKSLGLNRYSTVKKFDKEQLYNYGTAFAREVNAYRGAPANSNDIGMVFNARGATLIREWIKDGPAIHDANNNEDYHLFTAAVARVQSINGQYKLRGVIVDVGASDALYTPAVPAQGDRPAIPEHNPTPVQKYYEYYKSLIENLRTDFNDPHLPVFVVQQIYLNPTPYVGDRAKAPEMVYRYNATLAQMAGEIPNVHLIRSDGATPMSASHPDSTHHDHRSMDMMGRRIAQAVAKHVYNVTPDETTIRDEIFAAAHVCSYPNHLTSPECIQARAVKTPQWDQAEDIVILPHRGLWGFGDAIEVPENSPAAFNKLAANGYGMSEVDFTPTKTPHPNAAGAPIMNGVTSHDYIMYRVTDQPINKSITGSEPLFSDYTDNEVSQLRYRMRSGHVTDLAVASQVQSINTLVANRTLTVADIKPQAMPTQENGATKLYPTPDSWMNHLASVMYDFKNRNSLQQLSVKTTYTPDYIISKLPANLKADFSSILWMPQVVDDAGYAGGNAEGMGNTKWIRSSVDFIDVWQSHWSSILSFEANYKSPSDSRLHQVNIAGCTSSWFELQIHRVHTRRCDYDNILDYMKVATGYRGGVFAEEPNEPRGNVNRFGGWSIKNADNDQRGDPLVEAVRPKWGNFIVVTTDRPDVWKTVKCKIYGTC